MIYYNEYDPEAAAWLWELIDMGMIGRGIVDDRSIIDVDYRDLYGFDQHHFFAGIGGWSYALRLAGWPDDKPVWTASLPCQPFSLAGKQLGKEDERHLLPHFLSLVAQCRPTVLFGEQVSAAIRHGWLDDLYAEMEAYNYAVGSVVIGAHSIGAAHIRQRLYWVAYTGCTRLEEQPGMQGIPREENGHVPRENVAGGCGMVYPNEPRSQPWRETSETARHWRSVEPTSGIDWIYCRDNKYRPIESGLKPLVDVPARGMGHSSDPRNTQEARKMRLHGYGNAIVPQVAAEFINAYCAI